MPEYGDFLDDDFKPVKHKYLTSASGSIGTEEAKNPETLPGSFRCLARELRANRLAAVSLAVLILIVLASLFAPLSPYDPDHMDVMNKMSPPSSAHWFGTDELGRDSFTRALYGGRVSLTAAFAAMCVSVTIGTAVGAVSGFGGGTADSVLTGIAEIFQSVPSLLMIIIFFSFVPSNMWTLVFMLALFSWPGTARVVRAQALSLREREFVMAARTIGVSRTMIILRHIIPNMSAQIIVAASLSIAGAILDESALSFLGYGVALPMSSWGSMLQNSQRYILYDPLLAVIPGMFILLTVMCLNILGDALQHALDPRIAGSAGSPLSGSLGNPLSGGGQRGVGLKS